MADYIYLLENRLSPAQRSGLRAVREVARSKGLTVFLVGGAVRDLTSGSPVRDLDLVVYGNALKLLKDLEKRGAVVTGELESAQALFVRFPGGVRMEIGSTLSVTFPKPGKPVMKPATILEDLRRRDFTANAMALSLNDGSYGLLMDPLNGVADIENRQLRLVSNYGFIEDPVRMIRAARLMARLGWTLDEKTQSRYETGKSEGYISALSAFHRGYETEEIVHEEDPLRVLKRLEAEGWMKDLAPYWTSAKANATELEKLRDAQAQLQIQGVQPEMAAAIFPLLTAKLSAKEIATLKAGFPRQGFVAEIEALEGEAKEFAALLGGKGAVLPSQAWRLITAAKPEAVLWAAYTTKSSALQGKFKSFSTDWPAARQKMPYTLMQEMRIVPELAGYDELLEKLFFELMDGRLGTPEEMKAFLEPYSPPAPPPPVNMRKRAAKKEAKPSKSRSKKVAPLDDEPVEGEVAEEAEEGVELTEEPAAKPIAEPIPVLPVRVAPLEFVMTEPVAEPAVAKGTAAKGASALKKSVAPLDTKVPAKKDAPEKIVVVAAKEVASKKVAAPVPAAGKKVAEKAAPEKVPVVKATEAKKVVAEKKAVVVVVVKKEAANKTVAKAAGTVPAKKVPGKAAVKGGKKH